MGVDGAPHQHFPAASAVRRLEPFDVGQTRRIDLNDVKISGLFPELRVGVREEVLGVGERLDRAEDVEIFGEEAVPAAADGELAVEPSRGAEVEEGVLVGGDVAVDAVDAAVDAYAAVDLVVGEADLRRRGGRGGVGVRGGERRMRRDRRADDARERRRVGVRAMRVEWVNARAPSPGWRCTA